MDMGDIGSRPPVGTGIPGEVPLILVQHMKRGNTTRPVGVGIVLDVSAVLTLTLSYRVRTTTPVKGMNRSWSYYSVCSGSRYMYMYVTTNSSYHKAYNRVLIILDVPSARSLFLE
jgi:hypothetical protein